jgi:hypothetical protein
VKSVAVIGAALDPAPVAAASTWGRPRFGTQGCGQLATLGRR